MEEPQLVENGTSVTLVQPTDVPKENGLALVDEDSFSDTEIRAGIYELQKRRRSSIYQKKNPLVPVREEPYGWVVVFCVFMIHVIVDGLTYSFGALYPELLVYFSGSAISTSMVMSILVGTTYGCGPLASFLCDKFGSRGVALIGTVLACAGCLLSLTARTIWQLAFTYGALTGLGFGFMYLPAIVTVASWFERRRAIAVSISVCGSGFGTFLFSPLTTYLLEYYGFHGCMMIMAGVALQGAVFAALLRPPPRLRDSPPAEHPLQSVMRRGRRQTAVVVRFRRWFKDEVDWRLVTNWTFALYCTSSFLGGISCYVPYMFLADRAVEESGVEKQDAAWLMSAVGISNILGRLTSGILSDRKIADNAVLYSISCIVAGTATSMSIWCSTYLQYAIYACIFGYSGGIIVALQSVVLTDIVGVERISNAFGILLFVQGISVFVGPPFAGYLVEVARGSYEVCFIVFGVVMCLSGVLLLLIPLITHFKTIRRRYAYDVNESPVEDLPVASRKDSK